MNILRSFLNKLWLNKFGNSRKGEYYEKIKKWQWRSTTENLQLQRKLLYKIIIYALENIPYYQKLNLETEDFTEKNIFEDIKQIPLLSKEILRNNFSKLYRIHPELDSYISKSSGTTGEPVKFYQDREFSDWCMASKILYYDWAGRNLKDPMLKFWANEHEISSVGKMLKIMAKWARNIKHLDAFKLADNDLENYYKEINFFKPTLILGYSYSLYRLAQYIRENNYHVFSPQAVMGTAEMLYPKHRKFIEDVFNCPVFNRYGSIETGDVASECGKYEGMHLNIFNNFVEIIDEEGNNCQPGKRGEIVINTLRNYSMPLIRYRIGDMGIISNKKCSCGRGLPLLQELSGRVNDSFIREDGEIVAGGTISYCLGINWYKGIIKKYQVIQKDKNYIVVKVILKDNNKKNVRDGFNKIRKNIRNIMGENTKVVFEITDEILTSASGKNRSIISEINIGIPDG